MRCLIPDVKKDGLTTEWVPEKDNEGMQINFKSGNTQGMRVMFNKPPKWNESSI